LRVLVERGSAPRRRWNRWNLLLLVPFLTLVTPWFNTIEPRFLGIPFFYWFQLAWVVVGVGCVLVVNVTSHDRRGAQAEVER
jgi:hypothetical protein